MVQQKASIQAHTYAGITKFGATPLIFVTGTTKKRGPRKKKAATPAARPARGRGRGAPAAPAPDPPAAEAEPENPAKRGVDNLEYRTQILTGDGGLLASGAAIFAAAGVDHWRFQQDGAPVHTVAATAMGKLTRDTIAPFAKLVDPWPAHSPDLSPIEKAWALADSKLWETETWTNQADSG